ncbi:hypothetical protein [Bacillus sp. 165]|uniref:hypothetical protein n=1 Tax=Bacillus sp. 165 TaxID=1529117 RepID=UPI001ADD3C00|nr:hypothetical protein [Bacillus sp. 165]MBO9129089.1 hypothetical protein [Bacillus sp. 165]
MDVLHHWIIKVRKDNLRKFSYDLAVGISSSFTLDELGSAAYFQSLSERIRALKKKGPQTILEFIKDETNREKVKNYWKCTGKKSKSFYEIINDILEDLYNDIEMNISGTASILPYRTEEVMEYFEDVFCNMFLFLADFKSKKEDK